MLQIYHPLFLSFLSIPLFSSSVAAGFPSPADDFLDAAIDLNRDLIKNPYATFYARVRGNSMEELGINEGDLLVVDKSIHPQNGKIAVCFIDGSFTVKRIQIKDDAIWLLPANKNFKPTRISSENEFLIWGIVVHVIKSF